MMQVLNESADPREEIYWSDLVIEQSVRFDVLLETKSRDRAFGKRERTRFLVMSRVAKQLLDEPAKRPLIESVLNDTGLSRGTFYNYFTDIDKAIEELLCVFFTALWSHRSGPVNDHEQQDYDPVYEANLWYCRAYEANAGLFATFSQIAAYTPSLLKMRETMNAEWVDRVVSATARRRGRPFDKAEKKAFQGMLRLMIAMSIEALRERYVHVDTLLLKSFPDAVELAQGLTKVWRQTIEHFAGE
jgi:AcrR family transcriptional regulator